MRFDLVVVFSFDLSRKDDLDKADEIIYTRQGGNDLLGNHRQKGEQLLRLGNLALKVVDYWAQKGVQGHLVLKYRLMQLEGQLHGQLLRCNLLTAKLYYQFLDYLVWFVRTFLGGRRTFQFQLQILLMTHLLLQLIPDNLNILADSIGCICEGDCSSSKHCSCAQRNGSDLPYVSCNKVGRLVEPKAVVFECGANCHCHCDCVNRTSQQGLQYHLEVFKTASKGWGVRTWDIILPGAPICEYTGLLRKAADVDGLMVNNYIFDIDCLQTMKGLDGREQRPASELHIPSFHVENDLKAPPAPEYCKDAGSVGNVARFINHSCQPNLFVQCILSSHSDIKLAKVMLFSADTILPLQTKFKGEESTKGHSCYVAKRRKSTFTVLYK